MKLRSLLEELRKEEKYIIYVYFCDFDDPRFREFVETFREIQNQIDFWVKPGKAHHRGFAIQSILNTNNQQEAKAVADFLLEQFGNDILVVLSKQVVSNLEPIGQNNEEVFIEVGDKFDVLKNKGNTGVYFV